MIHEDLTPAMAALLDRQRSAFLRDGPPDLALRRQRLKRLRAAVLAHRRVLQQAVSADFGHRSRYETDILELTVVVQAIDYLSRKLRRFMRPERRHVALIYRSGRAWVEYQPKGVIGVMAPWNYPVALTLIPLATALAAGNRAMLKPSELTSRTSEAIRDLLAGAFPPEEVATVLGGPEAGAAFSALPFDHLFFTGSTAVGRKVMQAASGNLVPVTLELGGKSPVIVARGHADAATLGSIVFGKLSNAGQTCVAPDYALVHEDDLDAFVALYDATVARFYPEGTIISSGLSKWCGAGGWRLGTFLFPRELRWLLEAMVVVASETFTSTSAPIQCAAVTAFECGPEIEAYLARQREILGALGRWCHRRLVAGGVQCAAPEGGFYLFPDFSAAAAALHARGIETGEALCERLLTCEGVAILPGSGFGRPQGDLTARLAYVDFDGEAALAVLDLEGVIDDAWLRRVAPRVTTAIERIVAFVGGTPANS